MSLNLISRPVRDYDNGVIVVEDAGNWNAIFNPVIFHFERRDFTVSTIVTSPAFAGKIRVTPSATMTGLAVGDFVYVSSDPYDGYYEVLQVNGGGTSFDADTTYISDTASGFLIADSIVVNWYGEFRIYRVMPNLPLIEVGTWVQKSARDGTLKVDVSGWLDSEVGFSNDFEYDVINERDDNLGGEYTLQYRQRYDGEGEEPTYTSLTGNYYVNAARQIGDEFGANMVQYIVLEDGTTAKFLSGFTQPTYFVGYPFDLSFIMPDLTGSPPTWELTRLEDHFDINGSIVSTDGGSELVEFGNEEAVNRMMIQQGYGSTVKEIDVWLEGAAG